MRLSKIKLSGFKSFVEPTIINTSDSLIGVVGPNGCGKSNIIDALTWVMGESSAKHLRGEMLADILFKGTSERTAVSQAAVELHFDNTENKLGGQYSTYDTIVVKRKLNRDGVSIYSLNGNQCRRRDIRTLFLGTGLGVRGNYAIIEQGFISRLIETKSDELRVLIEEASGISKYRERRHETSNKLKNTRANIERLNDVVVEVKRQCLDLSQQAKRAEKYHAFKKDSRRLKAEISALKWKEFSNEWEQQNQRLDSCKNKLEKSLAEYRENDVNIERARQNYHQLNTIFEQNRTEFQQIGSNIASLEHKISANREKEGLLEKELKNLCTRLDQAQHQFSEDSMSLGKIESALSDMLPNLETIRREENHTKTKMEKADIALREWQKEWDIFNIKKAEYGRDLQTKRTRLEYIQEQVETSKQRYEQLNTQYASLKEQIKLSILEQAKETWEHKETELATGHEAHVRLEEATKACRGALAIAANELNDLRSHEQLLQGQLASLQKIYAQEMSADQLTAWLEQQGFSVGLPLAERIEIDSEWIKAVETVSENHLRSLSVNELERFLVGLDELKINTGFISKEVQDFYSNDKRWPRLVDKISGTKTPSLMHFIYVAEDIEEACVIRKELKAYESVVTKQGVWLGVNWAVINAKDSGAHVLSQTQEITRLQKQLQQLSKQLADKEQMLNECTNRLRLAEQEEVENSKRLEALYKDVSNLHNNWSEKKNQHEQQILHKQQIEKELANLHNQIHQDNTALQALNKDFKKMKNTDEEFEAQHRELESELQSRREVLDLARIDWQTIQERLRDSEIKLGAYQSKFESFHQAIERTSMQKEEIEQQKNQVENNLGSCRAELQLTSIKLEAVLKEKIIAEKQLNDRRDEVQACEHKLHEYESTRKKYEKELTELRANIEPEKIKVNEYQIRMKTLEEKLFEYGSETADEILQHLEKKAVLADWEQRLEQLEKRIQRLGPVNLAAIDEYKKLSERQDYLEKQHEDLHNALTMLEQAIHSIDKETRSQFKGTFDQVNKHIQELFSYLFKGGRAWLELTDKDLLVAGVIIKACPPGKKTSTINLLSGGEKALIAIAFLFSMFKLNPAPFCVLDEVDAPLDDTNTERFCNLVKMMSKEVQFIIITHNKITMEIAEQLHGITMQEPGISRLVSVSPRNFDIEQSLVT